MVLLEGINSTKLSSFAQIGSRVPAELVILPHTPVTKRLPAKKDKSARRNLEMSSGYPVTNQF